MEWWSSMPQRWPSRTVLPVSDSPVCPSQGDVTSMATYGVFLGIVLLAARVAYSRFGRLVLDHV